MGFSAKVLASATTFVSLGDGGSGFPGLGAIAVEDPWHEVYLLAKTSQPESAQEVYDTGSRIADQQQFQDPNSNTNPGQYHVAVVPVCAPEGFQIAAKNVVCHINPGTSSPYLAPYPTDVRFVVVGATLPAVSGSFNLTINSVTGYAVNNLVHVEGAGECTVTAISGNQLSLTYNGVPRAIVTIAA